MEAWTLTEGGQPAEDTARRLAEFIRPAAASLELALYDIRLPDPVGSIVADALRAAAGRGVRIRLLYNVDSERPAALHPPPQTRPELLRELPIEVGAVPGVPDLMHHKYVVRDAAAVWTGSANWTIASWTRQENVLAIVDAPAIAVAYRQNFEELWNERDVERSGERRRRHRRRRRRATDRHGLRPMGRQRPVGVEDPVAGDGPGAAAVLGKAVDALGLDTVHDFMHAKVTVAADTVFLGSFNLSRSGERNAENVLELTDPGIADRMAAFVDEVRARYPGSTVPEQAIATISEGSSQSVAISKSSAEIRPSASSRERIQSTRPDQ